MGHLAGAEYVEPSLRPETTGTGDRALIINYNEAINHDYGKTQYF
jgi:hypothetical protein